MECPCPVPPLESSTVPTLRPPPGAWENHPHPHARPNYMYGVHEGQNINDETNNDEGSTIDIKTQPTELNQKIIKLEHVEEYWSNEKNNMESINSDSTTTNEIKMEPIG